MKKFFGSSIFIAASLTAVSHAAFLIEIDLDGSDDGPVDYNPNFAFGGDTTTASSSSASTAFGLSGADSLFGGNGSTVDTYIYTYDPSTQVDNLVAPGGTALNGADTASGLAGGVAGTYAVYAAWPFSTNVSGGLTNFDAVTAGDSFSLDFDQTGGGAGTGGNLWIKLGEVDWTSGPITLTQESSAATFVSMRASGVLFERIPEPSTGLLLGASIFVIALRRRRVV